MSTSRKENLENKMKMIAINMEDARNIAKRI